MKNLNELVEGTLFDVERSKIEDCKEKMKNIILELNELLIGTDFEIKRVQIGKPQPLKMPCFVFAQP